MGSFPSRPTGAVHPAPATACSDATVPPPVTDPPPPPAFCQLFISPPQQRLELSETNKYSWPGASEAQERCVYQATWDLLQRRGVGECLCEVLRACQHESLPMYLGGNVPLNYYLWHKFHAPALVPSNDIDIKVDIGEHLRALLAARGGAPSSADKALWTAAEGERVDACKAEAIAAFVTYAKTLMDRLCEALRSQLPLVQSAMAALGIGIGPRSVHVHHKTHAAAKVDPATGKKGEPFFLVPLSGGVFQLMVELTAPDGSGEAFIWNVIDLEADWKRATPHGTPFRVEAVPADAADKVRGLRLLAPDELRADLEPDYQAAKATRRRYKKAYWDWAKAAHAEQHPEQHPPQK